MTVRPRLLVGALLLSSALTGVRAPAAGADIGAAIDLGHLEVAEPLRPGDLVTLPTLHVRNPGDERARYTMDAAPLEGGGDFGPAWVRFQPQAFELDPGQRQPVEATLIVPVGTHPGTYVGLLRAAVAPDRDTAVTIGGAAASQLTLTVADASLLGGWLRALGRWLSDAAPWLLAAGAVVVLVTLGRRYRIRVVPR